jgi:Protein of unknown function (DUF3592)
MLKALPVVLVGLAIAYGGVAELMNWLRSRHRLRRVTAVIVDLHDPIAVNPGSRGRSPVFRLTTDDGKMIDAVSSAWTFPEPKVGTPIPVTYDPLDPQRSAERVGVRKFKLIFSPLLIAFGLGFAIFGLTFL